MALGEVVNGHDERYEIQVVPIPPLLSSDIDAHT